jgi:hypothetical protein
MTTDRSDYYTYSELMLLGWTYKRVKKYLAQPDHTDGSLRYNLYLKLRVHNVRLPVRRPKYKSRACLPF